MTTSAIENETVLTRANRFFYSEEVPYGLALMRICLPLVLLIVTLFRWPVARELYSTDGATAPLSVGFGAPAFLPEFSATIVLAVYSMLVFFLFSSAFGWCTRLSLAAATLLYFYFNMLDAISTMTKYSVMANHGLLLLTLSRCGDLWSVDSWLKGRRRNLWPGAARWEWPKSEVWPRRLIQIFIAVVYFGAAMTKLNTTAFLSGDQMMYWMMTHVNWKHPLGEYLTLYPALLVVLAYISLIWEVTFIFLVWRGKWRHFMLGVGVVFHFMTAITLGLFIFPLVCYCLYIASLEERDIQQISAFLRRIKRKLTRAGNRPRSASWQPALPQFPAARRFAPAVYALAILLFAVAGVEAEYRLDRYGERRPEGRHTLRPLSAEEARRLTRADVTIRETDKLFAFDIGTVTLGGILLDRRAEFRPGDELIAQCTLTPPHEDMWVECTLCDPLGRIIERNGQVALREAMRIDFHYTFDRSLPEGEYDFILRFAGKEVARRRIVLR